MDLAEELNDGKAVRMEDCEAFKCEMVSMGKQAYEIVSKFRQRKWEKEWNKTEYLTHERKLDSQQSTCLSSRGEEGIFITLRYIFWLHFSCLFTKTYFCWNLPSNIKPFFLIPPDMFRYKYDTCDKKNFQQQRMKRQTQFSSVKNECTIVWSLWEIRSVDNVIFANSYYY